MQEINCKAVSITSRRWPSFAASRTSLSLSASIKNAMAIPRKRSDCGDERMRFFLETFLIRHPPLRFGASLLRKHCVSKPFPQIGIAPYALCSTKVATLFLREKPVGHCTSPSKMGCANRSGFFSIWKAEQKSVSFTFSSFTLCCECSHSTQAFPGRE